MDCEAVQPLHHTIDSMPWPQRPIAVRIFQQLCSSTMRQPRGPRSETGSKPSIRGPSAQTLSTRSARPANQNRIFQKRTRGNSSRTTPDKTLRCEAYSLPSLEKYIYGAETFSAKVRFRCLHKSLALAARQSFRVFLPTLHTLN